MSQRFERLHKHIEVQQSTFPAWYVKGSIAVLIFMLLADLYILSVKFSIGLLLVALVLAAAVYIELWHYLVWKRRKVNQ